MMWDNRHLHTDNRPTTFSYSANQLVTSLWIILTHSELTLALFSRWPLACLTMNEEISPYVVRYRTAHIVFGVIHIVLGAACFILELVAVCMPTSYTRFGAGIYVGVIFIATGIVAILTSKLNRRHLQVTCIVLTVVSACISIVAIYFCFEEQDSVIDENPQAPFKTYLRIKMIIVLTVCVFEILFSLIHSGLACVICPFWHWLCHPKIVNTANCRWNPTGCKPYSHKRDLLSSMPELGKLDTNRLAHYRNSWSELEEFCANIEKLEVHLSCGEQYVQTLPMCCNGPRAWRLMCLLNKRAFHFYERNEE